MLSSRITDHDFPVTFTSWSQFYTLYVHEKQDPVTGINKQCLSQPTPHLAFPLLSLLHPSIQAKTVYRLDHCSYSSLSTWIWIIHPCPWSCVFVVLPTIAGGSSFHAALDSELDHWLVYNGIRMEITLCWSQVYPLPSCDVSWEDYVSPDPFSCCLSAWTPQ